MKEGEALYGMSLLDGTSTCVHSLGHTLFVDWSSRAIQEDCKRLNGPWDISQCKRLLPRMLTL